MKNITQRHNLLLAAALFLGPFSACLAQNVPIIGLDQLEQRLEQGSDTTYVVNFWATWCGPCVKELPYFEQLHQASEGSSRKVILVSLDFADQLESKVVPFVKQKQLRSEVVLMDEERPNEWIPRVSEAWSGALPATLFVNGTKNVRHFHEGSFGDGELEQKLTELGL